MRAQPTPCHPSGVTGKSHGLLRQAEGRIADRAARRSCLERSDDSPFPGIGPLKRARRRSDIHTTAVFPLPGIPMRSLPLLLSLYALVLGSAHAAPPPAVIETAATDEIVWTCAVEPRATTVLCRRGALGLEIDAALEDEPAAPDNHAIRQKLLARDGGSVGRLVRTAPASYDRLLWRVPLHTVPTDDAWLHMLVESVMCGNEARCRVEMGTQRFASAQLPLTR
jgi:hypothetical protein